jgi:uncharacterized membrane protein
VRLPFFWSEKTGYMPLPLADGFDSARPYGINDHGQIVGEHRLGGGLWYGFMYDMTTGEYMTLPPLHEGATALFASRVQAINNAGIAAGMRIIGKPGTSPMPHNAVIWDTNTGKIFDLGVLNGPNSAATAINEHGNAAGWTGNQWFSNNTRAVLWLEDETIIFGPVPGGFQSYANAVSNSLFVVGTGLIPGSSGRAFLWKGEGMTVVPPLPPFTTSSGLSVNDLDQAGLTMSHSGTFAGYLWQHGAIHNINDLAINGEGITLQSVSNLNNQGQILSSVPTRAALLTPVDVPVGDLNLDCRVDFHDILLMFAQWGPVSRSKNDRFGAPCADLSGDGVVNVTDLLILFDNWTN